MRMMDVTDYTVKRIIFCNWVNPEIQTRPQVDWLNPVRQWLDKCPITNLQVAHRICKLIPAQCPFARQIKLFGRTLLTIPPLCKLNPLYDELMMLRFRALCYLEECGEDISAYC